MNAKDLVETYLQDKLVFGEDTRYIYEEIYSDVMNEKISFKQLDEDCDKLISEVLNAGKGVTFDLSNTNMFSKRTINDFSGLFNYSDPSQALVPGSDAALSQFGRWMKPEDVDKIATNLNSTLTSKPGFFSGLLNKIKNFVGGLKGKSFVDLFASGKAWLLNPANTPVILGTTGGIVLLAMVIRALKKRNQLNNPRYKNLLKTQQMLKNLKESDNIEMEVARNEIIKECETNLRLRKIFENQVSMFNY